MSAGSVTVDARLIFASTSSADAALSRLQAHTPATLSTLLSVSVTATQPPSKAVAIVVDPRPPSPPAPPVVAIPINSMHLAHGLLMTLAWGVLLPMGAVMPRTWRNALESKGAWYKIHRTIQSVGVLLSLIGVIVSISFVPDGYHFSGLHKALGLVVSILALVQPAMAFLRPHKPAPGEAPTVLRQLWRLKHAIVGYSLLALGAVQVITGVNRTYGLEFLYGIYGAGLAATVALALVGLYRTQQRPLPPPSEVSHGVALKAFSSTAVSSTPSEFIGPA